MENTDYNTYILNKICDMCDDGNYKDCEHKTTCPVIELYNISIGKGQIVNVDNNWLTTPSPQSEMN